MGRPEEIKFVKISIPKEEFEEFDSWLIKMEMALPVKEDLKEVVKACKNHYGEDRFNEIFDIPNDEAIEKICENWIDIAQWEFNESLKYD